MGASETGSNVVRCYSIKTDGVGNGRQKREFDGELSLSYPIVGNGVSHELLLNVIAEKRNYRVVMSWDVAEQIAAFVSDCSFNRKEA